MPQLPVGDGTQDRPAQTASWHGTDHEMSPMRVHRAECGESDRRHHPAAATVVFVVPVPSKVIVIPRLLLHSCVGHGDLDVLEIGVGVLEQDWNILPPLWSSVVLAPGAPRPARPPHPPPNASGISTRASASSARSRK
mmetsp:Transcript_15097/g.26315  ORF Transcript_15097/g.26315 Transcript_15097/m.26315 type:complete len:138 (-) Transcript_15097:1177-1590(-)